MSVRFLEGGGAMGALTRNTDWSMSPLGSPQDWPQSLKAIVGVMLGAPQPMFVVWGAEQLMLYNDAYTEILGGHHPALGQPFFQVWAEIIHDVGPIMARAYAGESIYMDDIELVSQRHGHAEEAHFSFFYAPVRGEHGSVQGVFCGCNEITTQVMATRERRAELQRLREMFEQSPSFVAVLRGPEHRFELTNAAYRQLTGQRDVAGKTVREALPEVVDQDFLELLDSVYASGQTLSDRAMPLTVLRGEGGRSEQRIVDWVYQPLRDAAGQVNGIFVEGIDVTTSHAQAHVLRESEEKFRTFAQAVPNHVWTAPADGLLEWFNDQTLAYSGMPHAALVGTGWVQLVHPQDTQRAADAWALALAAGSNYEIEFRIRRADGAFRWHLVRALPIRNSGGTVVRWVGTNTDIDDQRADREALLALNTTLERRVDERTRERERIWRNSPDMMAVLSLEGVFQEVNPIWKDILGWTPHQLVGQSMTRLVYADDLPGAQDALVRAAVGVLPTFECRCVHADGSLRFIAWTAAPEGRSIFAFGRDITGDKAQKQALELAEDQLRQSQKMESIGQLTGGIAHDFNNMLASIYGSIQLMQRRLKTGKTDDFAKLLDRASTSAQRAAALTQRLLAFARRQSLDITRVDVAQLVSSLEDMLVRTLGPRVALQIGFGADLWPARIDASQLENALLNLVINARDAMPDGGKLTIEAANAQIDAAYAATQRELTAGDYVVLSVSDDGMGMPAHVIARAFEPFFTTKPIGQGTGLGLSMVYGFVKQAGGHVRIHSQAGKGTTVSLYLPRDLTETAAAPTAVASRPASHAGTGETILVVEDEDSVRAVIVSVLEELGYRFIEAANADAALLVIESGRPVDLLVTDVGLPGMNGRQLAEIACEKRPNLKVLFVTGYAEQAAVRKGFLTERMHMIAKPFVIDELAELIRAIIQGTADSRSSRVSVPR
jgi:PAS domain S-box-containing protein